MDISQSDLAGQQKLQSAFQMYQMGNLSQAEKEYREIMDEYPNIAETYQYLAIALMDRKEMDEAVECLETGLSKWPESPYLLTTITSALSSMSKVDEALKYAKKTASLFPTEPDAQFNYAGLLMAKGLDYDALSAYASALKLKPDLAIAHYNIGCIRYRIGEKENACEAFLKAIELDGNLLAAHSNLGQINCELEKYEDAIDPLEKVIAAEGENPHANKLLGMAKHFLGDYDTALKCFLVALKQAEKDSELNTLTGNAYRDIGNYEKAIEHYQQALETDPNNELAQKNLSRLQGGKLASWHAHMLADGKRNKAYDQAIRNAVTEKTRVLDIGAGSGLLSLMAARAGSKEITACEMTPIMADIAKRIVKDNEYTDVITIHNLKSSDLEVGRDMEQKADLIISEILDMSVIGEGVIPAMRHAKEHLLAENGTMIPRSANIFGVLLETEYSHHLHPLNQLEGFDLSYMADYLNIPMCSRIILAAEPHKKLSDVFPVVDFDFMDVGPLIPTNQPRRIPMTIPVLKSGIITGVAFWFHLHLDDEVVVTTEPNGDMIHWGQSMCYFEEPVEVKAGDKIAIEAVYHDTSIWFESVVS